MGEGATAPVETVELRVMEVQRSLDVGMAEIKGTLGVLLQGAQQMNQRLDEHAQRVKEEFERRDRDLTAAFLARDTADNDREGRLRGVERRVYMAAGAAGVLSASALFSHFLK